MGLIDLVSGVSYVAERVGLNRLDKGLRDSILIPADQLPVNGRLESCESQTREVSSQIQQHISRAWWVKRQQLDAAHAQLMAKLAELQQQLQQLESEKQMLVVEAQKEKRLAEEWAIVRLLSEVFDQAQLYRQQRQFVDSLAVYVALLRIDRQVSSELQDTDACVRLSDLRERVDEGLRLILGAEESRGLLATQFSAAISLARDLVSAEAQAMIDAASAVRDVDPVRPNSGIEAWRAAEMSARGWISRLEAAGQSLRRLSDQHEEFCGTVDPREIFYLADPNAVTPIVGELGSEWATWSREVETLLGESTGHIERGLIANLEAIRTHQENVSDALDKARVLEATYQLGYTAESLAQPLSAYRDRYKALTALHGSLPSQLSESDLGNVVAVALSSWQLDAVIRDEYSGFLSWLRVNGYVCETKYARAASERLEQVGSGDLWTRLGIGGAIQLGRSIVKLERDVATTRVSCQAILHEAAQTDELFAAIERSFRDRLGQESVQGAVKDVAARQPDSAGHPAIEGSDDRSREISRRHLVVDSLLERQHAVRSASSSAMPSLDNLPQFPRLLGDPPKRYDDLCFGKVERPTIRRKRPSVLRHLKTVPTAMSHLRAYGTGALLAAAVLGLVLLIAAPSLLDSPVPLPIPLLSIGYVATVAAALNVGGARRFLPGLSSRGRERRIAAGFGYVLSVQIVLVGASAALGGVASGSAGNRLASEASAVVAAAVSQPVPTPTAGPALVQTQDPTPSATSEPSRPTPATVPDVSAAHARGLSLLHEGSRWEAHQQFVQVLALEPSHKDAEWQLFVIDREMRQPIVVASGQRGWLATESVQADWTTVDCDTAGWSVPEAVSTGDVGLLTPRLSDANAQYVWPLPYGPGSASTSAYFRDVIDLDKEPYTATIEINVDDAYELHVNGQLVGRDSSWWKTESYDVAKYLQRGRNVLAVSAVNSGGGSYHFSFSMVVQQLPPLDASLTAAFAGLPTPSSTPLPTSTPAPTVVATPTLVPTVAPTSIATPDAAATAVPVVLSVANTGGEGVYLRRTPSSSDRLKPWPERTRMVVVGPDRQAEGKTWKNVRDPDGNVGWIPAEFLNAPR